MSEHDTPEPGCDCVSRRQTLRYVGASGVVLAGAGTLAGCGGEVEQTASSAAGAASSAASSAAGEAGDAVKKAEIPVGGGKVFESLDAVVTQPTEGEFKAFSATCTHAGCLVNQVGDGTIDCPCHGSKFDIATGAVVEGPASEPLPEKSVTVSGDGLSVT
ncbi:Rieske (2Fe-2S) protein [Phycicoccus flavus]|uniref:Rieske (2Fe-2S) protein n=1 Tax=Phycicoccus flavus TaxID=2502783 RepID=UPI000FEBD288|nr:Rieske (2Fe-2S) protein [Phycicoccus flavus]NHA70123.1 Rieske (2Fe-2S) protein [Phycicoccus flavus]